MLMTVVLGYYQTKGIVMAKPEKPTKDAGYLEAAARIIFMGGLNRQVVDGKWEGFLQAFHGFDVPTVAAMGPADIDRLASDDRVIKYSAKLQAIVFNAREMQEAAEEYSDFGAYINTMLLEGLPTTCVELSKRFSYISKEGARNWLYSTGHDVGEVTDKVREKYAPYCAD